MTKQQQPSIVFVSAYYSVGNDDPQKSFPWRLQHFQQLLQVGLYIHLFTDDGRLFASLLSEFPQTFHLTVLPLSVLLLQYGYDNNNNNIQLPAVRNHQKDTFAYMFLMNMKPEFVSRAIHENHWKTAEYYAWLDFNIVHIFQQPAKTLSFLQFLSTTTPSTIHLSRGSSEAVLIAGCHSKKNENNTQQHPKQTTCSILWRFCGGFFIGDKASLLQFHKTVVDNWSGFFVGLMVWEVNYWAWLEQHDHFRPLWYAADHNDTIITHIPAEYYCRVLCGGGGGGGVSQPLLGKTASLKPQVVLCDKFPTLGCLVNGFMRPSNTTFFTYGGNHYLNVRYINYELGENGTYTIYPAVKNNNVLPSQTICSQNVLYKLQDCLGGLVDGGLVDGGLVDGGLVDGGLVDGGLVGVVVMRPDEAVLAAATAGRQCANPISCGWEDLRIWERSGGGGGGELWFFATHIQYTAENRPQMFVGRYDVEHGCLYDMKRIVLFGEDGRMIDAPQKNWIPLNSREFIYQWTTAETDGYLEIGELMDGCGGDDTTTTTAKITRRIPHPLNNILQGIVRGSSCFVRWDEKSVVGVVHFSKDYGRIRKYYHSLVVLEETTWRVVQYTPPFVFVSAGIEFCIGFHYVGGEGEDGKFHFWFSQNDIGPFYYSCRDFHFIVV